MILKDSGVRREFDSGAAKDVITWKAIPGYEGCKIWNKESAEVYLKQAATIVKTHVNYKCKNCKVELVRMESGVIRMSNTNDIFQVDYLPEKKEIRINLPEEVWNNIDTVTLTRLFQEELVVEKQQEIEVEDE